MEWQPELDELRRRKELASQMGGQEKVARQHAAGRLTVRERLSALLDEGSFEDIIGPRETRPLLCDWVRDAYAALPAAPGRPSSGTRP